MVDAAPPLTVQIPAPASATSFFARSAKGEIRTDAAAPPSAASHSDSAFSFADFLDVINPLQHIPGVNLIYQAVTGDKISTPSNVAGGILYGGAIGGLAALAMSMFDELGRAAEQETTQVAQKETDPTLAS